MNLRMQYSLRQALPVALFGLPLLGLEQVLARVVSSGEMELAPTVLALFAFLGMPVLAIFTFTLAYQRFYFEYRLPTEVYKLFWGKISFHLLVATLAASLLASGGIPENPYQWMQLGVVQAGVLLGVLPFKWIFFDWLERLASGKQFPPDDPGSSVGARLPSHPTPGSRVQVGSAG